MLGLGYLLNFACTFVICSQNLLRAVFTSLFALEAPSLELDVEFSNESHFVVILH